MLNSTPMQPRPNFAGGGTILKGALSELEQLFSKSQLRSLQRMDPTTQVATIRQAAQQADPKVQGALTQWLQSQRPNTASKVQGALSDAPPDLVSPARRKFLKQSSALAARTLMPNVPLPGILKVAQGLANPEAAIESAVTNAATSELGKVFNPKQMMIDLLTKKDSGVNGEIHSPVQELNARVFKELEQKTARPSPSNFSDAMEQHGDKHARAIIEELGHALPEGVDPRDVIKAAVDVKYQSEFPHVMEQHRAYGDLGELSDVPGMDWFKYHDLELEDFIAANKTFPSVDNWLSGILHPNPLTKSLGLSDKDMIDVHEAAAAHANKGGVNLWNEEAAVPTGSWLDNMKAAHKQIYDELGPNANWESYDK